MMEKTWNIEKKHCYKTPYLHIYCPKFISLKIYEKLYEQWNNIEHMHWQKFIKDNEIEIYFHDNLVEQPSLKKNNPYVGYWFFKQRTDKKNDNSLDLSFKGSNKIISCIGNDILILQKENKLNIRHRNTIMKIPFCELYFNQSTNEKVKELLS